MLITQQINVFQFAQVILITILTIMYASTSVKHPTILQIITVKEVVFHDVQIHHYFINTVILALDVVRKIVARELGVIILPIHV
jgi:hypothetical protein